jgi:hypothetical protein
MAPCPTRMIMIVDKRACLNLTIDGVNLFYLKKQTNTANGSIKKARVSLISPVEGGEGLL